MSEMVERVRDAIEMAIHKAGGFQLMSQQGGNSVARAAIKAMREPTEAMTKAGNIEIVTPGDEEDHLTDLDDEEAGQCWQAMIDEALK